MKLPEAIEVIRIYKEGNVMVAHERLMEAIDAVVAFCEKQLQCDCVIGWEVYANHI